MRNPVVILPFILVLISLSYAQDAAVKAISVTNPLTLTTSLCSSDTDYTFLITICEVNGTAATVTAVNLYYTDNANFQDRTTTGTAAKATLGNSAAILQVTADGEETNNGATATLAADAVNCPSYTHICAVATTTDDTHEANDDACIALAGGVKSTSNCPPPACDDPGYITDGQKIGESYNHKDTVTYSCNEGFELVGAATMSCYDGAWDNSPPTCTVIPTTEATQTGTDVDVTEPGCGAAGISNGIYCVLITLCIYTAMIMQ